jgi:hypothetical protein
MKEKAWDAGFESERVPARSMGQSEGIVSRKVRGANLLFNFQHGILLTVEQD